MNVHEMRHKDALQSRAMQVHGGQCVTVDSDNKTTTRLRKNCA